MPGDDQRIYPDRAPLPGNDIADRRLLELRLRRIAIPQLRQPYIARNELPLHRCRDVRLDILLGTDRIDLGLFELARIDAVQRVSAHEQERSQHLTSIIELRHLA